MKILDLKSLVILVLLVIILLLRMCSGNGNHQTDKKIKIGGKKYTIVKHTTDTIYTPVKQIVYRDGKTIYVDKPIYVEIPGNVDTNEILKDYYTKYPYVDTLILKDNMGYVKITDTIFKNGIQNRIWDAKINKITIRDSIFLKEDPKRQLFIGGILGFDKVNFVNFAGPSLVFKDKQDKLYSLGVGYNNSKTISIQGGIYWKIGLKKNGTKSN